MARVFIDGLEDSDPLLGLWENTNLNSTDTRQPASSYEMDGNYCFFFYGGPFWAQKNLSAAGEYYFSFWLRPLASNSERIIKVLSGSTVLCALYRTSNSDGYFKAYRGDGSTLLATSTTKVEIDITYQVRVYIKIDDVAGRFKVIQGDTTVIDYTGDTKPGTETTIDSFVVGAVSGQPNFAMDNVIVDDSEMPPEKSYIQAIVPNGAGSSTQWDPSTGSNYQCVDETPYSDADYVSTNTIDEIDTYTLGDLTGAIGGVNCIQVQTRIAKEGTPTPTKVSAVVRTGSTNYAGTAQTPDILFGTVTEIWGQNPNTSTAWTESDINGLEAGVKAVS